MKFSFSCFLVILSFLFGGIDSYAQGLRLAEEVEMLPNQIYASTHPRTDKKDKYCGLVMVHSALKDLKFKNEVGGVKYENGIYYVYLSPGTKKLEIIDGMNNKLTVQLPEIASKTTYQTTITRHFSKGSLVCKSDPAGASVTLHSPEGDIKLGQTPIRGNVDIAEGEYTVTISKPNYNKVVKKIKIKANKTTDLGTIKLKK